jgi:hypothetical protein
VLGPLVVVAVIVGGRVVVLVRVEVDVLVVLVCVVLVRVVGRVVVVGGGLAVVGPVGVLVVLLLVLVVRVVDLVVVGVSFPRPGGGVGL